MAELNDIIHELVQKTKSNYLKWMTHHSNQFWQVRHTGCVFTVSAQSHNLTFIQNDGSGSRQDELGRGDAVQPLIDVLSDMYPISERSSDVALLAALECLTEQA